MAIINGARASNKEKLKVEISAEILERIRSYCQWSDIASIDYFLEESACFVFAKDKEWKAHLKSIKRAKKSKNAEQA